MKNSTHSGKGKAWGSLVSTPKADNLVGPSSGESHSGKPSTKFCGPTKGNTDLPPNRTSGVKQGGYKGT